MLIGTNEGKEKKEEWISRRKRDTHCQFLVKSPRARLVLGGKRLRADVVPRRETGGEGKKREEKAGQAPGSTRQPIPKGFGFHSRSRYRIISDVNSSRHISSCSPENEYRFREFGQITKKEKLYTIACCARVRVDFSSVSFSFSFLIFFFNFWTFPFFLFFFFFFQFSAAPHSTIPTDNPIQFSFRKTKKYTYMHICTYIKYSRERYICR